jgi:ABC-2 type transport system permease protein
MIGFLLLARIAHKLVYYGVALGPFALVFFLCRDFFPGLPEPPIMAAYVASLVMGFLIGFFLEATIGMIGFWFLEVTSLLFVYMLFNFFLSGHMFPIDMLSGTAGEVVRLIPLQYLAYFPAAVFLGKVQGADLAIGLAIQLGWLLFFIIASRLAFGYGVKRYSGFGG